MGITSETVAGGKGGSGGELGRSAFVTPILALFGTHFDGTPPAQDQQQKTSDGDQDGSSASTGAGHPQESWSGIGGLVGIRDMVKCSIRCHGAYSERLLGWSRFCCDELGLELSRVGKIKASSV